LLEIVQPATGDVSGHPDAVVHDRDGQGIGGFDHHGQLGGVGVPNGVGDGLAHHRLCVFADLVGHRVVDRASHPYPGRQVGVLRQSRDQVQQSPA
jgi:hypothetical protein